MFICFYLINKLNYKVTLIKKIHREILNVSRRHQKKNQHYFNLCKYKMTTDIV